MLQKIRLQLTLVFYALSYFTRVPIPNFVGFDNEQFHKANAYFPLVGGFVSLVMIFLFYISQLIFSLPIAIIVMLIGAILLTGALHEDGFADCCDGLGGGYDATQRLKIMKDSRIGTYAGVGLVVLFLLKYNLLLELATINSPSLFGALLIAHTVSRFASLCLMQSLSYVRLADTGKVQALAPKLSRRYFIFASLCTLCTLLLCTLKSAMVIIVVVSVSTWILRRVFIKNIAGYTGDCLGFAQQCIEIIILLLSTALLAI